MVELLVLVQGKGPQPTSAASGSDSTPDATRAIAGRRYVVVLFTDVSGSSRHAEQMEAEDYAALLQQFRAMAHAVIPKHGGEIVRLQGDGLLALFGHLFPSEDDGRHAVEAALALHEAVGALPLQEDSGKTSLQLHSGIHAGLVLLIEGDIELGRFDVVGEAPNTASRLCSLAAAGEIWVSEPSLGPHAHFFEATRLRRMAIRGRSAPLHALRIVGRAPLERRLQAAARRGVVPLVGRQEQLDLLIAAADDALKGGPARWILAGEPGLGKSRLLDTVQSKLEAAGYWVIQGSYEGSRATQPLHAFAVGLRGLIGGGAQPASDAEADGDGFLQMLGADADTPVHRQLAGKVLRAEFLSVSDIAEIVHLVAQHGSTALLLDDWQWADDASHQVLQRLSQSGVPLFVLQCMRTPLPESALHDGQVLTLDRLDAASAAQLVASWVPDMDPFVAAEIDQLAGGNPLFIEELCHTARAGYRLPSQRPGTGIAWLNALIASRLTTLRPNELECLQLAAVAGHATTVELLERIGGGGRSSCSALVEALAAKDFLLPAATGDVHGGLRFKHALTRDAVYATIEAARRRELHSQVATALETGMVDEVGAEQLDALANHYHAARVPEKTVHFAELAGDRALKLLASDRARDHYIVTLEALGSMGLQTGAQRRRWCLVAQKLGNSCVFDPIAVRDQLPLFRRAVKLAHELQDHDLIARAEYWLGYIDYGRGQPGSAIRHCEAALYSAQTSGEPRLIAQVQATLGQSLAQAGQYERARPLLAQAVNLKRQHSHAGSRVAIGSAYTLSRTAYVLGDLGLFDEAHDHFDQALALMGGELHPVGGSIYTTVSAVHLWQGRWDAAAQAARQGVDIALRCRSHYLVAMGRALLGCALWAEGGDAVVLRRLRQTCRDMELGGGAAWMSLIYGWLVEGHCALGESVNARSEAARLMMRARVEDRHGLAMGCRAMARHAIGQGDLTEADRYLERANEAASCRGSPREASLNAQVRAQLLRSRGSFVEAAAIDRAARDELLRMGVQAAPGFTLQASLA